MEYIYIYIYTETRSCATYTEMSWLALKATTNSECESIPKFFHVAKTLPMLFSKDSCNLIDSFLAVETKAIVPIRSYQEMAKLTLVLFVWLVVYFHVAQPLCLGVHKCQLYCYQKLTQEFCDGYFYSSCTWFTCHCYCHRGPFDEDYDYTSY